ncbi:hypothetical protein KC349_g309 [Hortaea werneckii]|nr:hypothetical protein KC349_g309 [Hortaea werneckii]
MSVRLAGWLSCLVAAFEVALASRLEGCAFGAGGADFGGGTPCRHLLLPTCGTFSSPSASRPRYLTRPRPGSRSQPMQTCCRFISAPSLSTC